MCSFWWDFNISRYQSTVVSEHICNPYLLTEDFSNIWFLFEKPSLFILSQHSQPLSERTALNCGVECVCFNACLCVFLTWCCRNAERLQGVPGGADQGVGGPEGSVLPAEHGAEGWGAAGTPSRPLLHLCPDLLQAALHGGRRWGGKGGDGGGGGSAARPVHLQEGLAPSTIICGCDTSLAWIQSQSQGGCCHNLATDAQQ